jgi:ribonuclease R
MQVMEKKGVPVGLNALARHFDLKDEQHRKALGKQLRRLVSRGRLMQNRRADYCLLAKVDAIIGKVSAHRDGFGFLLPDDGSDDIFLPPHAMRQLMDGDRAAVHIAGTDRKGRPKGDLVEILERGKDTAVGRFISENGLSYVLESSKAQHHYLVAPRDTAGARHGEMVKLEIVAYPTARREAVAKVIKVLGAPEDPGMLTTLAIESFGLRDGWSDKVQAAAEKHGDKVREADKKGRTDLRKLPLVTIDGADARDFDDAVYAEPAGKGWRLVVAIADVSHYVRIDDALDNEARARGTSTYFPDRVVPMLPEEISNGLCSLNPKVDRLCLVCDMRVTSDGKVEGAEFYKAVMRSHARFTYSEVDAAVGQGDIKIREKARKKIGAMLPHIEHLYELYRGMARARARRGALDLDLPEVVITMADEHTVESVAPRHRNDAHRLIEECMIAANVQAAKFLHKRKLPNLYRVHPQPEVDRFEVLRLMLQELDFKVTAEARTQPGVLNKILQALKERSDFAVLATSVLRTLSQAVYQPVNEGHYGLALDAYAHFTSPIRRYPDLLVHRGIAHLVEGGKPGAFHYKMPDMEVLGRDCSTLERQAEAASRHVESRYKCVYISKHVGDEFAGIITSVTHFGLFVMLEGLYVEGLVHVTSLKNDYYHAEHGGLRLRGEHSGRSYGLGDTVRVRVTRVDVDEARVDLAMIDVADDETPSRPKKQSPKQNSKKKRRRR